MYLTHRASGFRLSALLVVILLLLSTLLIAWRVEHVLLEFTQGRGLRVARQVGDQIEDGFRLGLSLADQTGLPGLLERQRAQDPTLQAIRVQDETGRPAVEAGVPEAFAWVQPAWPRQLMTRSLASISRGVARHAVVGLPVLDGTGQVVATVWLVYERSALRHSGWTVLRALLPYTVLAALGLTAVLGALASGWLRAGSGPSLLPLGLAVALVFAALSGLAWKAQQAARPLLAAQIDQNAQTVLQAAHGQVQRALRLGIPMERLAGVEAVFADELQPAVEAVFLALRLPDGRVLVFTPRDANPSAYSAEARDALVADHPSPRFPWLAQPLSGADGRPAGELVIGTAPDFIDRSLSSILVDLLLALVVSLVLVRETLGGLWQRAQPGPRPTAVADLGMVLVRLRLIVFFTALSEELMRPFFAVFASEAELLWMPLSPAMLAGLPVAAFMLTLTLAQPIGPWFARHADVRRSLFAVALGGSVLMVLTAATRDAPGLVLLRAGSGVAHGLLLILAQTTVVRITTPDQRARGLVDISAAIVAAGVCGPALGGLLAERFGPQIALVGCGASLLVAALFSLRITALPVDSEAHLSGSGGWRGLATVLRQRRVMAVTWLAAVPARLVAAALLVVVTPLYLLALGESPSMAGRVLLLYFVAFMLAAPPVARWSDRHGRRKPWIMAGSALSALSCAALPLLGGVAGAAVCCALLGVAQALLSAPQLAWVTEAFERDPQAAPVQGATPEQALAAFRFIERFGSVVAPFVVALAVARFGLIGAVGAIGTLLAACTLLMGLALLSYPEGAGRAVPT